ncbi:hypothetical protein N9B53_03865 [Mariniblastus sp.]|nr:hypothetical protein [Mariniblastus sp.]
MVYTDVGVSFALGHPDDGGLDSLNLVLGKEADRVLAPEEIPWLKLVNIVFKTNLQRWIG